MSSKGKKNKAAKEYYYAFLFEDEKQEQTINNAVGAIPIDELTAEQLEILDRKCQKQSTIRSFGYPVKFIGKQSIPVNMETELHSLLDEFEHLDFDHHEVLCVVSRLASTVRGEATYNKSIPKSAERNRPTHSEQTMNVRIDDISPAAIESIVNATKPSVPVSEPQSDTPDRVIIEGIDPTVREAHREDLKIVLSECLQQPIPVYRANSSSTTKEKSEPKQSPEPEDPADKVDRLLKEGKGRWVSQNDFLAEKKRTNFRGFDWDKALDKLRHSRERDRIDLFRNPM